MDIYKKIVGISNFYTEGHHHKMAHICANIVCTTSESGDSLWTKVSLHFLSVIT